MKKKQLFLVASIILLLQATTVRAQMVINIVNLDEVLKAEPLDDLVFTVQYHTTFLHDTEKPDTRSEETMMLKVGKKLSQYYSYSKFLTDSIVEVDKKNGASQEVIAEHMNQYSPKVVEQVFKNYPSGKVTTLDRLAMSSFKCEEQNEIPKWEILPDTTTILIYPCQKAICNFKGRQYEAWFTSEIPRSEGPWKLNGLPGLILKAQDSRGHYTFEATVLIQNSSDDKIMYAGKGYEPVSRKELNKMHTRFAADPMAFIAASAPHVNMRFYDDDGQPAKSPKNTPYNPLELEEK